MSKIIIEKQRNNKIFVLFSNLLDISSEIVRNEINNIVNVFSKNIIAKIISGRLDIIECVKECTNESLIYKKNNKDRIILFQTDTDSLRNLLEIISRTDDASMELYVFDNKLSSYALTTIDEAKSNFYMFITDNDGVTVIFDSTKYDYKQTLEELKKINI